MVSVDINIKKQKYPIQTKEIRDETKLAGPMLAQNFKESATIDEAASQLNTELHKALDATAPIKSIKFNNRPKHPWFNKYIREQKSVVKIMKENGESTISNANGKHIRRRGMSITGYRYTKRSKLSQRRSMKARRTSNNCSILSTTLP